MRAFYYTFIMRYNLCVDKTHHRQNNIDLLWNVVKVECQILFGAKNTAFFPALFTTGLPDFEKKGCEIPAPINKDEFLPLPHQDVVKVNLVPDIPFIDEAKPEPIPANAFSGLRLELGGAKLEISNDVNLELLVSVLHFLRDATC